MASNRFSSLQAFESESDSDTEPSFSKPVPESIIKNKTNTRRSFGSTSQNDTRNSTRTHYDTRNSTRTHYDHNSSHSRYDNDHSNTRKTYGSSSGNRYGTATTNTTYSNDKRTNTRTKSGWANKSRDNKSRTLFGAKVSYDKNMTVYNKKTYKKKFDLPQPIITPSKFNLGTSWIEKPSFKPTEPLDDPWSSDDDHLHQKDKDLETKGVIIRNIYDKQTNDDEEFAKYSRTYQKNNYNKKIYIDSCSDDDEDGNDAW